jgi:hypothetical protein
MLSPTEYGKTPKEPDLNPGDLNEVGPTTVGDLSNWRGVPVKPLRVQMDEVDSLEAAQAFYLMAAQMVDVSIKALVNPGGLSETEQALLRRYESLSNQEKAWVDDRLNARRLVRQWLDESEKIISESELVEILDLKTLAKHAANWPENTFRIAGKDYKSSTVITAIKAASQETLQTLMKSDLVLERHYEDHVEKVDLLTLIYAAHFPNRNQMNQVQELEIQVLGGGNDLTRKLKNDTN